jgi:L-threonylcarbamoyladenylate synthase
LQERHYAPRTPLECVTDGRARIESLQRQGLRVGWLVWAPQTAPSSNVLIERLAADPEGYAAALYAALHRLDQASVSRIIVDLPPEGDAWTAVHDRLRRASQPA